jgi:hypothetical protein
MLDLKGVMVTVKKLNDKKEPGEVVATERAKHTIYSYVLNDEEVFAFGITRSPKAKSLQFHYVPEQMGLQRAEYRDLHGCPMSKAEFNMLIKSRLV